MSSIASSGSRDRLVEPDRSDAAWTEVTEALGGAAGDASSRRLTLLDTFDWRLYRRGDLLVFTPGELTWRRLGSAGRADVVVHRQAIAGSKPPAFAADLDSGPLREALERRTEPRRLLEIVTVDVERQLWNGLDDERKTVVRVERLEVRIVERLEVRIVEPRPRDLGILEVRFRVLPLRGYDSAAERARRVLDSVGRPAETGVWRTALAHGTRTPGAYRPKERVVDDPAMASDEALCAVLRKQLAVMRESEDGVLRDLDIEFLHDYRVALRRSRSALQQLAKALPADAVAHFKSELRWLGHATGPLRDLDVYQLKLPAYRAALPAADAAALEPLARHLERRRRSAHAELVRTLRGPRATALLEDWARLLDGDFDEWTGDAPWAERPIGEAASSRITKRYRGLIRDGGAIDASTPDEVIHDLRIDGKKLRYLLEFFGDLYPPTWVGEAITALKKLQDHLGDFNDYSVQQEALRRIATELRDPSPDTLLALGSLLALLREKQQAERVPILAQLERFGGDRVREHFDRLR